MAHSMTVREILVWGATGLGMTLDQFLDADRDAIGVLARDETDEHLYRLLDALRSVIPPRIGEHPAKAKLGAISTLPKKAR